MPNRPDQKRETLGLWFVPTKTALLLDHQSPTKKPPFTLGTAKRSWSNRDRRRNTYRFCTSLHRRLRHGTNVFMTNEKRCGTCKWWDHKGRIYPDNRKKCTWIDLNNQPFFINTAIRGAWPRPDQGTACLTWENQDGEKTSKKDQ